MEVATNKLNPPCELQAAAGTLVPIPFHASDGNWGRLSITQNSREGK